MIPRFGTSLIDHVTIRRPRAVTRRRRRLRPGPEALEGRLLLASKVGVDPGPLPVPPVVIAGPPPSAPPPAPAPHPSLGPSGADVQDLYNRIKHFENDPTDYPLDLPRNYRTVDVGTLDAATGQFRGLVSTPPGLTHDLGDHPHQDVERTLPIKVLSAVDVGLTFHVQHRTGDFEVIIDGGPDVRAAPGQTTLTVNVGHAFAVDQPVYYTIRSGGKSHSDGLVIRRPPVIGAFTLPALYLGIAYAPPLDAQTQVKATFTLTNIVGMQFSLTNSRESSTTVGQTNDVGTISTLAGQLGSVFSIPKYESGSGGNDNATGQKSRNIGSTLTYFSNLLSTLFGSDGTKNTPGKIDTRTHAWTASLSQQVTLESEPTLGPGDGDRIIYLKDVKVVWLSEGSYLHVAILGATEGPNSRFVKDLKHDLQVIESSSARGRPDGSPAKLLGPSSHLDADTIRQLLSLDPFVAGGPNISLAGNPRFVPLRPQDNAGRGSIQNTFTVGMSQTDSTDVYTVHAEDTKPGLLSFLGIGPSDDKSVMTKITDTNSNELNSGTTISETIQFSGPYDDGYYVQPFIDLLGGGFAMTSRPASRLVVPSGVVTQPHGTPAQKAAAPGKGTGAAKAAIAVRPSVVLGTTSQAEGVHQPVTRPVPVRPSMAVAVPFSRSATPVVTLPAGESAATTPSRPGKSISLLSRRAGSRLP
jgi:hypothetical protein